MAGVRIWCHASPGLRIPALMRLLDRLVSEAGDLTVSLTAADGTDQPDHLPGGVAMIERPPDQRQKLDRFLDAVAPDLALFAGSEIISSAIAACRAHGVPAILLCGEVKEAKGLRQRISDLRLRGRLRQLDRVFASSEGDAQQLRRLGADPARIEVLGPLEEGAPALPYNESEGDALAGLMMARPVWLAAMVRLPELPAIAEAQRAASRMSHRLLLIVVPADAADGPAMADWFTDSGWQTGLRSDGAEPEADYQVYIADTDGELGLWYRLAPTTFLGSTLSASGGGGHDPYGPAALGSAIVHGPFVSDHRAAFRRLADGRGTRCIDDGASLGRAICDFLSPDRAAQQAHRAWEVSSQGAEASDRAVEAILTLVDERVP